MHYKQLSDGERYQIAVLKGEGLSRQEIAKRLGRHRSTIYRELARNVSTHDGYYRPNQACEQARARRSRSRRNRRYSVEDFRVIDALIRRNLSPEQIVGRLTLEKRRVMSHEVIYRHVWEDKGAGGNLYVHLRGSRKQKRKRYGGKDSRGRLAGKKMIGERPAAVALRKQPIDWEMDTIHGSDKGCAVTIVERCSRFTRIGPIPRAGSLEAAECVCRLLTLEPHPIRSITSDNGTEFHNYRTIEKRLNTKVYFATPHHAWERGTNENTNGLIRQYLPKGTNLDHLTIEECTAIANKLNHRPRKCLGYRTPYEVYYNLPLSPV